MHVRMLLEMHADWDVCQLGHRLTWVHAAPSTAHFEPLPAAMKVADAATAYVSQCCKSSNLSLCGWLAGCCGTHAGSGSPPACIDGWCR